MSKLDLTAKTIKVWNSAEEHDCSNQGCGIVHRLCGICKDPKRPCIYGAHHSKQPKSKYSWNIDHIKPISENGSNRPSNLRIVHSDCNSKKGNTY